MIVRIMGDGQYRVDEAAAAEISELDDQAVAALDAGDEQAVGDLIRRLAETVRSHGTRLNDSDLSPSDGIVPPDDLTLEEARELFSGEGLIPDLPA